LPVVPVPFLKESVPLLVFAVIQLLGEWEPVDHRR
jgi:hypothetical protein